MTKVIIRTNPLEKFVDEVFHVDKVGDFLYGHFKAWPETAVIYQSYISKESEIPLRTHEDVANLNRLSGSVYIVIYPASLFAVIGVALIGATLAITNRSDSKESVTAEKDEEPDRRSPNNQLSERSNKERIGGRIPDIFGKVRAVPDLLMQPYKVYQYNRQVEFAYYCVGRGAYQITDVRDGEALISNTPGTSLEIYGPNTSPNFEVPETVIGSEITEEFIWVKQSKQVTGQELLRPGQTETMVEVRYTYKSNGETEYQLGQIKIATRGLAFDEMFQEGDSVTISHPVSGLEVREVDTVVSTNEYGAPIDDLDTHSFHSNVDISGSYIVESRRADVMVLEDAATVNANWTSLLSLLNSSPFYIREDGYQVGGKFLADTEGVIRSRYANGVNTLATLTSANPRLGPFLIENAITLNLNIVAPSGLYQSDGTTQTALQIDLELTIQPVDATDTPVGTAQVETLTMLGSDEEQEKIGETFTVHVQTIGRVQVYLERTTVFDSAYTGTTVDTIKWEALYAVNLIEEPTFGNVTTIRTRTVENNTTGAIQNRELNMFATRLIQLRVNSSLVVENQPSQRFSDIAKAVITDGKIGNRPASEYDELGAFSVSSDINTYFDTNKASHFNFTFDDKNMSLEETLAIIADAVHCTAYRQGKQIKFHFEKETDISSLLFNHRNKMPNTETRTVTFGYLEENDGVELQYLDSEDGETKVIYLPSNQSADNPQTITQLGITDKLQAYFHAHRIWNRIQYQNTVVEFDATQEAALLALKERIRIADNTRPTTFDGEVMSQDGLNLLLSQDFEFEDGKSYTIFLQNIDGTVQAIAISAGSFSNEVVLAEATNQPLALGNNLYARTTYEIIENSSERVQAFLVQEKTPRDNFIIGMRAVNYDSRYYQNDKDYENGVVDIDGNEI